jgi:DNA-directed RNA polymerase subunit omega
MKRGRKMVTKRKSNSMIDPSINELLEHVDSKYTLVSLIAKRARKLQEGYPQVVECDSIKPVTIACNEVAAGEVAYTKQEIVEEN